MPRRRSSSTSSPASFATERNRTAKSDQDSPRSGWSGWSTKASLGQVDGGFGGLALREQDAVLSLLIGPILEQAAGRRCHMRVAAAAPQLHATADVVDEIIGLDAIERPLVVELQLSAALLRQGHRHEVLRP